jgi:two-component system OmpR family sensor kinase
MYDYEFISVKENLKVHYHKVAKSVMLWHIGKDTYKQLLENLENQNIEIVDNERLYQKVLSQKKFDTISCGMQNFYLYEIGSFRYMITPENTGSLLLKDLIAEPIDVNYMWLLYGAFVLVLFTLFLSIAISIYPLKHLQLQIRRFGEGEMDLDLASDRKDEIAEVSNEFDKAVGKIKGMMNSRAIFLRNITHELKTPITKGQLSLEFLEDSRTKEILTNVFMRLNLLTREFVQIENVTACDCQINKKSYHLADIFDNAVDLLFLEPESINHNIDNRRVEVDFELMSIVFKNLLDNGIKYSEDGLVFVNLDKNKLSFCSVGPEMENSLEYYIQPFTKCDVNTQESFGLGLYIVYYILDKHGLRFSYKHENGLNCFVIHL